MTLLGRKLFREVWHLRGQMLAVAAVVACGISVFVAMKSVEHSLASTRLRYYAEERFADVFLGLKRAPLSMVDKALVIEGVAAARGRIVADVTLDVSGLSEPATGRLLSMPDHRRPVLNDLVLVEGRYFEAGQVDEVIASRPFMEANGLNVGDRIGVVINGRWSSLRIVGTALSPEYIYEVQPGGFFPDNRRFGVFWMSRSALASALDMEGAFNDLSVQLSRDASEAEVLTRLDHMFRRYGGVGAYGRGDHFSDRFIADEIRQVGIQVTVLPTIFLCVGAFLLNIVLRRLVSTQRQQVAVMKAMGYTNIDIGLHYLGYALLPVSVGALAGTLTGLWLGRGLTAVYSDFYNFAELYFMFRASDVLLSVLLSFAAAIGGAYGAVRSVVSLPPAEGMRPEAPSSGGLGVLDRSGVSTRFSIPVRLILRNIERRPFKSAISSLMIAFSLAILVAGRYGYDAVSYMMFTEFSNKHREDVTVMFNEQRSRAVGYELAAFEGVVEQELYREEPARLVCGHRSRRQVIQGIERSDGIRRLLDARNEPYRLPRHGLLLTTTLATSLGASPGDTLDVEFLQGERRHARVVLQDTIDELLGLSAYMHLAELEKAAGASGVVSAASLRLDAAYSAQLFSRLKELPGVAGVTMLKAMKESFEEVIARSTITSTLLLTVFAGILAFAVVYNGARISLSERGRELSSLRVLGYTRREIALMLLGEQAVLTIAAIPFGFGLGMLLSYLLALSLSSELYRMPLVFMPVNFVFAFFVVVLVALISGVIVKRSMDRLDLIAVLKTRE